MLMPQLVYGALAGHVYANAARDFNGSSQLLARVDDAQLSMGAGVSFTIAGWVILDALADQGIAAKSTFPAEEYGLYLDSGSGGRFRFFVVGTGGVQTGVSAATFGAPSTGVWYFVCARHRSGTNIGISVNAGTEDTASHATNARDLAAAFQVGRLDNTLYLNGGVDSLGVWKRALSDAEVVQLYNGGLGRAYYDLDAGLKGDLVEWWDLDEASGNGTGAHAGLDLTHTNNPGTRAGKR